MPLSTMFGQYDAEREAAKYAMNKELIEDQYHYEKVIGKRKSNGALKLKELKPEHKQYISAYINGMKGVEIAAQFNVAAITVYRVLADPLSAELIGEFDESFKNEFRAMFPLVADAVRDGLVATNSELRLKAVDRWTKVSRFLGGDEDDEGQKNEKTTQIIAARMRFVELVKSAAPSMKMVEAEIIEVTTS